MLRSGLRNAGLSVRWIKIRPWKAAMTARFDAPMGSSSDLRMPPVGMPKSTLAPVVGVLLLVLSQRPAPVENPNQIGGSLNVDYEF